MLCVLNAKPTKYPIVNTQFYFRSDICVVLQAAYKNSLKKLVSDWQTFPSPAGLCFQKVTFNENTYVYAKLSAMPTEVAQGTHH